jgi:hypothetical protein
MCHPPLRTKSPAEIPLRSEGRLDPISAGTTRLFVTSCIHTFISSPGCSRGPKYRGCSVLGGHRGLWVMRYSTKRRSLKKDRVRHGRESKTPRSQRWTSCMLWLRFGVFLVHRSAEKRAHETTCKGGKNKGKHTPRADRLEPNQRPRPSQPGQSVYSHPCIDD